MTQYTPVVSHLTELENMLPYEREVYLALLNEHIKEENNKYERGATKEIRWLKKKMAEEKR